MSMNSHFAPRRLQTIAQGIAIITLIASVSDAAEPARIWVDANGRFSIEARLIEVGEKEVTLLRKDDGRVKIAIGQLSKRDQEYLQDVHQRASHAKNPLRLNPPKQLEVKALQSLDLPPAGDVAADGSDLEMQGAAKQEFSSSRPMSLDPDRSPQTFEVSTARIPIENTDLHDECSRPIPIVTSANSETRSTSIAMSVSSNFQVPGQPSRNELVRFNVDDQSMYVAYRHHDRIRLLDHHADSGRSLVLTNYNSLGKGGQFAIASGWDGRIKLSHRRKLNSEGSTSGPPHVRWARWVDEEHFLAVIDQTLSLWNIVSGKQVYQINGINHQSTPAISGGRRYVAVPISGAVQFFATETGKPLGRIGVEKQVPGVSFSPLGNTLAIATSRRLRFWDLPSATLSSEIVSRTSLGGGGPAWVDNDLVLSSSGVLSSTFRGLTVWRYDFAASEAVTVGRHVVMLRKHPTFELAIVSLPHEGAAHAMGWIDSSPAEIDREKWRIMGRSGWNAEGWADRDVQISARPGTLR